MVLICLMGKQILGGGGGGEFELHTEALYGKFFYEISVYQKLFLKLI